MANKSKRTVRIKDNTSKDVIPIGKTNIITDNKTVNGGNVENKFPINAVYARRWIDDNHL